MSGSSCRAAELHGDALALQREQLDDAALERAWARGRLLSEDGAVALALGRPNAGG
ncbi:MAG TPA: hypothetical protein VNN79_17075 [Actinomycetota bacterium]|nr:hypothetical protein [Actinomycetota bacterium]